MAARPIEDRVAYRESLQRFVSATGMFMRPVFMAARAAPMRVVYAEGEDERTLRAVQIALEEGLVQPTLIGRPAVVASRIERAGLRLQPGKDFPLINPEDDARFRQFWEVYHRRKGRDGVTPEMAKSAVRRSNTPIAALSVHLGYQDGMLCGLVGRYEQHLDHVQDVIGLKRGTRHLAALNALMLDKHTLFIADTFVNEDPDALKMTGGQGVTIGPILLGAAAPAHILTPSATVRRVVNMTALTVAGAR